MNTRLPLTIPIHSWYRDHSFQGTTVLAAVETMILLAAGALRRQADLDVRVMTDVRFAKFLAIPPRAASVEALLECQSDGRGGRRAKLLSQVQIGRMRRIKEHGEVCFHPAPVSSTPGPEIDASPVSSPVHEIPAERLYRELVPFGPCYRTLQGTLLLSENGAWGKLQAPALPFTDPVQDILGSPFPLDGAMHAACVLGQQLVDYAPFPVGFTRRVVARPTQPGGAYLTRVDLISINEEEQIYDLGIFNGEGELCETVTGLRMRDVRRGLR